MSEKITLIALFDCGCDYEANPELPVFIYTTIEEREEVLSLLCQKPDIYVNQCNPKEPYQVILIEGHIVLRDALNGTLFDVIDDPFMVMYDV